MTDWLDDAAIYRAAAYIGDHVELSVIRAAILAAIPETHVVVPRKPTEAMCVAWGKTCGDLTDNMTDEEAEQVSATADWQAMIAAADGETGHE